MSIAAGSRIGPYEIVGWLGAGGMGEVYRAHDPRLGRDVAIKLLPEAFAADPIRLRRFEQEARAAGQLNHPNILAVYDVGTHAGAPYIVSELLEGESLRTRLQGGALVHRKATDYARQIADGLAAAHEKNIVHRDVKPDNLFITGDERVKILDFGIAKLTMPAEAVASRGSLTETAPDTVLGSASYMSPEQVRGEDVDARSDIFSLGSVLYEMLAGQAAFARDTTAEMVAAILKEDPRLPLSATVPPSLERIVMRCLEKTREARFQSARDLAFGLEFLLGSSAMAASSARGWRWRWPATLGIAAVAAAVVIGLSGTRGWFAGDGLPPPVDFTKGRFSYVTQWTGTEGRAEISPDGNFIGFMADRDGEFDIFVSQIRSGEFLNVTTDLPEMNAPGSSGILRAFGFSGDSTEIWSSRTGKPSGPKRLMRLLSRTSHAFLSPADAAPTWSPDGRQIAYFSNNGAAGGDPIFVADSGATNPRQILIGGHNHNPAWSPDGQWIYFVRGSEPSTEMDIWRIRPAGGSPERMTEQHTPINFLAPLDARTVLFISRAEDQSGPWLWALDVVTRAIQRVSIGVNPYTSVSASRDGQRIVVTVTDPVVDLWTVPILDRQAEDRDVQRYPTTPERALAPRLAGDSLFYLAASGAADGLWRLRDGEASAIWPGSAHALAGPAAASKNGQVAVVVADGSKRRLILMSADGSGQRTLAPDLDIQGRATAGMADFSPDGAWIVVGGRDAKGQALFKIPTNGGQPVRLVEGQAVNPIWSPKGDLILYADPFGGEVNLFGVDAAGKAVTLPPLRVRHGAYQFMPDGSGLVYLENTQSQDFMWVDLHTGARRQLTRLGDHGLLHQFAIRPDGKQIVFDRTRDNSNVALIELPAKPASSGRR